MKRQWRVCRQTIERPDASQRWDRAYQSILQWALEAEPNLTLNANGKEVYDAGSSIRQSLDSGTGEATDY